MTVSIVLTSLLLNAINMGLSQKCLSSPPELEWAENDGEYFGTITMDAMTFNINEVTFTSRVLNSQIPGPTIRMIPGKRYFITLVNNLGPEKEGEINTIKELNYTILHTHGLHISGESPADDVFVVAKPGGSITAIYETPCFHSGGTFWYHPHHHGSTAVQVGAGSAGALIIEPNDYEISSFPNWYNALYDSELILVVQNLDLEEVFTLGQEAHIPDQLFKTSSLTAFYVINGLYQPTICLKTNVFTKLRISHVNIETSVTLKIMNDENDSCSLYLLSKDGVLIHGIDNTVPRKIPSKEVYLTVASRADVVIRCTNDGIYNIQATTSTTTDVIGYIQVTTSKTKAKGNDLILSDTNSLIPFHPLRPKYLQSLLFHNGYINDKTIILDEIDGRFTINGQVFAGPTNYLFKIDIRTVQEWSIIGAGEPHPYHQHLNHFQIVENCNDQPDGWSEIGDWIDTVDFDTKIRFVTNTFGGVKVIHCHILDHEDKGMMAVIWIDGGCDALYDDIKSSSGSSQCDYHRDMCADINSMETLFSDYNWYNEIASDFKAPLCPIPSPDPVPVPVPAPGSDSDSDSDSSSSDSSSDSSSSDSGEGMIAFGDDETMEDNNNNNNNAFVLVMIAFVVGIICISICYYYVCVRSKTTKYRSMSQRVDGDDEKQHNDNIIDLEMVETVIGSDSDNSGDEGHGITA